MWIKKIFLLSIVVGFCFLSCKNKTKTLSTTDTKVLNTPKKEVEISKLPYFATPDFNPMWISGIDTDTVHKISNFNFTDQLGNEVTNKTFKNHIYIANFFFTTCPSICIKLTNHMHQLQELYLDDADIKLLSHTVYPSYDTVAVLKEYAERHKVDSKKWHLVTGNKEEIYKMAREAYFADDEFKTTNDESRFVHTENLILIDKKGHIRGVYKGTSPKEIQRIQRHITILKKE